MSIEINDPIHKTIVLSPYEQRVADHPYIQRLRFVGQLGFASLVYPSATHMRFSHALGTMHVAGFLADQIFYNKENSVIARVLKDEEKDFLKKILRLAGLLHDVGHAPFSHVAERVMPKFSSLDIPRSWLKFPEEDRPATHEDYGILLLAGMAEEPEPAITLAEAEIIASLIHKKVKIPDSWHNFFSGNVNKESLHALVRSLISGDIDADRMDYLLRDSHFTGVAYGRFEPAWLISNLGSVENDGRYLLSISESGVHALEYYLFARYHMYAQVYLHKTARCFEYYFHKAIEEGETEYKIPSGREEYVAVRDAVLYENLLNAARKDPSSWSARLIGRRPAKRVARIWGNTADTDNIFAPLAAELDKIGVHLFSYHSQKKFLEDAPPEFLAGDAGNNLFKKGLSVIPIAVVRNQLGVKSLMPLNDYSFILKYYHRDISVGDIYMLPEEYKKKKEAIMRVMKNFRKFSPAEINLD